MPRGQVLVVTDVEWNVREGPTPLVQGTTLFLQIYLSPSVTSGLHVFQSRGVTIGSQETTGRPGTSEQLTAGFLVSSAATICPNAIQGGSGAVTLTLDNLILRGYLMARPVR